MHIINQGLGASSCYSYKPITRKLDESFVNFISTSKRSGALRIYSSNARLSAGIFQCRSEKETKGGQKYRDLHKAASVKSKSELLKSKYVEDVWIVTQFYLLFPCNDWHFTKVWQ